MSGNKIIPILDVHKDVFVHGGAVKKEKYEGREFATELVLCTECTFKLHQHKAKPALKVELKEGESPPPPPLPPKPLLKWRVTHDYIHSVIPLGGTPGFVHPYGFAVIFFSFKAPKAKPPTTVQLLEENCTAISNFSNVLPHLRAREYLCASQYEQDDWCTLYRIVLGNYWHKRLEEHLMPAPEIYQYQCFGFDQQGSVRQLALSTTKLYIIPRHDQRSVEHDDLKGTKAYLVASLKKCKYTSGGTKSGLLMQFGSGDASACFFSDAACSMFVVELQRIFSLALGEEAPFPFEE